MPMYTCLLGQDRLLFFVNLLLHLDFCNGLARGIFCMKAAYTYAIVC